VDPSKLPRAGNDESPNPAVSEERARTDTGPSFPTWIAAAVGAAGVAVGLVARRLAPTEANPRSPPPAPRRMHAPSADQLVAHGFTLLEERRFAQAVQPLREGIRSRPTDPVTRYALASALARSGQTPEALRQFDYAIRLNERFLALLLKDPDLDEFIRHADVHRFIRAHAARYRERVQRPYA
jgi:tetratricopeptide (TPR) repeat protein